MDLVGFLLQLDLQVESACELVAALISGNPPAVRVCFPELLQKMIPLLSSALASPRIAHCYLMLRKAAFEGRDPDFGEISFIF